MPGPGPPWFLARNVAGTRALDLIFGGGHVGLLRVTRPFASDKDVASYENGEQDTGVTQLMLDCRELPGDAKLEEVREEMRKPETTAESLKSETTSKATALHMAAEAGAPKIVEQLLKKAEALSITADLVNALDSQNCHALLLAAKTGEPETVKLLVEADSDLAVTEKTNDAMTAIQRASLYGHAKAVEAIVGFDEITLEIAEDQLLMRLSYFAATMLTVGALRPIGARFASRAAAQRTRNANMQVGNFVFPSSSRFDDYLVPSADKPVVPVLVLQKSEYDGWLESQSEDQREFLAAAGGSK